MIWVIFPAWNEEKVIRPTLLALWRATVDDPGAYTAVLVDDGSTDRTVEEAHAAVQDSGGALRMDGTRARVRAYRKALKPETQIGIHAHQNLSLAVANSRSRLMIR